LIVFGGSKTNGRILWWVSIVFFTPFIGAFAFLCVIFWLDDGPLFFTSLSPFGWVFVIQLSLARFHDYAHVNRTQSSKVKHHNIFGVF